MNIQHYDEEFPYVIITDLYTEDQLLRVWEELDFLCYKEKSNAHYNINHDPKSQKIPWAKKLTNRFELHLNEVYFKPQYSNIWNVYNEIFKDNMEAMIWKHPHWFFNTLLPNNQNTLVSYYENTDYYLPHQDNGYITMLSWLFKEPKRFTGGVLKFSNHDKVIELESNKAILFPGAIPHEVSMIKMDEEYRNKKLGRWCITTFISTEDSDIEKQIRSERMNL